MSVDNQQLRALLDKYVTGTIGPEEAAELSRMVQNETHLPSLQAYIDEYFTSADPEETGSLRTLEAIKSKLKLAISKQPAPVVAGVRKMTPWLRMAAAASVILIVGVAAYFVFFNKPSTQGYIVQNNSSQEIKAPATNRASITLANGQKVYLDSVGLGQLATEAGIKLIKLADGRIAYGDDQSTAKSSQPVFNTLSNPRGSNIIDMQLSDGSHVWLNAGSSITYPVAFVQNERKVTITGEAYFEVAHDATKKFIVEANGSVTEVLGTHFNVNAYEDEKNIKVTLLEGSVKTSVIGASVPTATLKPGEQAVIVSRSSISIDHSPGIDEVMAWKNGRFLFNDSELEDIMRELARWYNLEVVYTKVVKEKFHVEMTRNTNLSKVFEILEATGGVHFKIDGKKITVMP